MHPAKTKTNAAILSVASNSLLIVLKLVVGLFIGSVAILSEAIHSGVDLLAALIALFAVRASSRGADERHPYGHGKFENLSGTVEALLILAAAGWIIYEAVKKLIEPQPLDAPGWGVGVMLISALVNILVSKRLFKVGRETDSVALRADAWHLRTDVYTSIGVMFGLLVIWVGAALWPGVNLSWLDPAVAIFVALLILRAAYDLTRESARDLLDVRLPDEDVEWIVHFVVEGWPQVRSFHHLQTRKAGPTRFVDFHVALDEHMSVAESHALTDEIVVAIKERLTGSRIHIHVEPCDYQCPPRCLEGCVVDEETRERGRAHATSDSD